MTDIKPAVFQHGTFAMMEMSLTEKQAQPASGRVSKALNSVAAEFEALGVAVSGPGHAFFQPEGKRVRVQVGYPCEPDFQPTETLKLVTVERRRGISQLVEGPHSELPEVRARIEAWIVEKEAPKGEIWREVYLRRPGKGAATRTYVYVDLA